MCGLENNSVTWHCLNCECVSFLAPIYKETLKKNTSFDLCGGGNNNNESASAYTNLTTTAINDNNDDDVTTPIIKDDKNVKCQSMDSDCGQQQSQSQRKCQFCMYKPMGDVTNNGSSATSTSSSTSTSTHLMCRHQNKTKFLRFPLIGSSKIGPEQKSFDDAKHYAREGLYYSNRKINKSLSSINDHNYGPTQLHFGGNIFGERILSSSSSSSPKTRPNTLIVNELSSSIGTTSSPVATSVALRRSPGAPTINDSYSRQLSVPSTTIDYSHIDEFVVSPQQQHRRPTNRLNAAIASSILCTICGVCNHNRCMTNVTNIGNNTGNNGGGGDCGNNDNSRFTITTLSRSGSLAGGRNKNLTMPKNGGVFVAVKDWSIGVAAPITTAATTKTTANNIIEHPTSSSIRQYHGGGGNGDGGQRIDDIQTSAVVMQQDHYYEILKNPNNNPPYENQAMIHAAASEQNEKKQQVKSITSIGQQPQQMYENQHNIRIDSQQQQQTNEPIYAIVNKMNKSKYRQSQNDSAKYTFIGLTPNISKYSGNNSKVIAAATNETTKNISAVDSLYASIGPTNNNLSQQQQQQSQQRFPAIIDTPTTNNMKTSHITITSSGDHPSASDTSEIYTKVWKGPRKSLDSQKMYVLNTIFSSYFPISLLFYILFLDVVADYAVILFLF